jgi:hypothetical protein
MPFKKGTSGNLRGRPKGSVSTTTKLIREHISQAIDGNKTMELIFILLNILTKRLIMISLDFKTID